jgi:outer membrane murein-binding lipoprotein Lpp
MAPWRDKSPYSGGSGEVSGAGHMIIVDTPARRWPRIWLGGLGVLGVLLAAFMAHRLISQPSSLDQRLDQLDQYTQQLSARLTQVEKDMQSTAPDINNAKKELVWVRSEKEVLGKLQERLSDLSNHTTELAKRVQKVEESIQSYIAGARK